MCGFVCLTIFLIGSNFRGAQSGHLDFSNNRKLQGISHNAREFRINNNFSEGERNAGGKAFRAQRRLIPLVLGFAISAVSTGALMAVKSLFLKGAFLLKLALIISGFIIALKISKDGMLSMQPSSDLYPVVNKHYPGNEPDLSGYGYEHNSVPGFNKQEYKHSPY